MWMEGEGETGRRGKHQPSLLLKGAEGEGNIGDNSVDNCIHTFKIQSDFKAISRVLPYFFMSLDTKVKCIINHV